MTDSNQKSSNVAMEQIIENMTSGIHNVDGQYVQLNFTPPSSPPDHSWDTQNHITNNQYIQYSNIAPIHNPDSHMVYSLNPQIQHYNPQSIPFNYIPQTNIYSLESYEKSNDVQCNSNYVMFQNKDAPGFYQSDYRYYLQHDRQTLSQPPLANNLIHSSRDNVILPSNPTQLIENVVGNWVPNMSGTYSPFGNAQPIKKGIANIFEMEHDSDCFNNITPFEDYKSNILENENKDELHNFHFNREPKKPRMVAEVKPMRPTYSDVLSKCAPQVTTKLGKVDLKDTKIRKENIKKGTKSEKISKMAAPQPRFSKCDLKEERNMPNVKTTEKSTKHEKSTDDNRKWVSLDNINDVGSDLNDDERHKLKKSEDNIFNSKTSAKIPQAKVGKFTSDFEDIDTNNKSDSLNVTKTTIRKGTKLNVKQRNMESFVNGEKPPPGAKRGQRTRKRENHMPFGILGQKIKQYIPGWWKLFMNFCLWLLHLISDICTLSIHLSRDMVCNFYNWITLQRSSLLHITITILGRVRFFKWLWSKFSRKNDDEETNRPFLHSGLHHNITMPFTGEEAMKRLLACKGKDPYSILGVTPTCTDDDIKRYYKRQAFLVHPDKNQQPGAEEAFKILVHAFDMIGEPERRASYDRGVAESAQVEQAWSELTELLAQLQKKVEAAANTIRCSACGLRHKRIKIDRPSYAARNCSNCKIHHAAREGDIWAETSCLGFLWHYYACMEGGVYDITEWAGCQKESLKHLRPNSHNVQYRIALGKQNNQSRRHSSSPRSEKPPDLENLLNSLYGKQDSTLHSRRKNKKANK
ncbi:hypothetical protein RI129_006755 [Pyrocoelia pectoralis]|uniref:J domain-containing protein n=1 Tax=Pyrocoelia pectoralis TaxID=417401 RepID=A0AAN7ZGE7_9COLE